MIEIHIPVEITPKGRPRFTRSGRVYTPAATRNFERAVALHARQVVKKPLSKPLEVDITVKKRPPKSWSKKKQKAAIEGRVLPAVKPDLDNYGKSLLDGMNGVAFEDDNQICELRLRKVYAEEHGAVVKIRELKGE